MPDPWGIDIAFNDGYWGAAPPQVRNALLSAMGADQPGETPPAEDAVRVVRQGKPSPWENGGGLTGKLRLEDGTSLAVAGALPPDLPLGYHELATPDGRKTALIVAPPHCPLPAHKNWAWVAQLYATRSRQSWGIGDLADLGAWQPGWLPKAPSCS